jgi:hypothetical protein
MNLDALTIDGKLCVGSDVNLEDLTIGEKEDDAARAIVHIEAGPLLQALNILPC